MRTYSISRRIACLTIFLIIISANVSRPQHVITFTDRTELKAYITYQSKDTVKYYLVSRPEIVYVETMNHIVRIVPFDVKSDSLMNLLHKDKKYMHHKKTNTTGIALMAAGAIIGGIGVAGWVSTHNNVDDIDSFTASLFSAIGMGLGSAAFIAGTIMTLVGSANMTIYKKELLGSSVEIKFIPREKGISLVYRF